MGRQAPEIPRIQSADPELDRLQTFLRQTVETLRKPAATPASTLSWTAPTLQNGWVNTGAGKLPSGYLKDSDGFVHLRGFVNNGTSLAIIFNLPAGFRPSAQVIQRGYGENPMGTPSSANVYITAAGDVTSDIGSGGPGVSFDGISFDTR